MKIQSTLFVLLIMAGFLFQNPTYGQNIYVDVYDAATYRPLQNVRITLQSETASIVFFTNPDGELSEHVPAGIYSISLSATGYHPINMDNLRIYAHELTSRSFALRPDAAYAPTEEASRAPTTRADGPAIPEPTQAVSIARGKRIGFVNLYGQAGNIQSLQGALGLFLFRGTYVKLSYAFSRQNYSSPYFLTDSSYHINFNNLTASMGYEYSLPLASQFGVFVNPGVAAGLEQTNIKTLLDNEEVDFVLTPLVRPYLSGGLYFGKLNLFLGVNYAYYLGGPMNQGLIGLYDSDTDLALSWDGDLFSGRKGIGLFAGIQIGF